MKRFKIWSMMMLVVVALPFMVACGSDEDGGGATSYTEAEIIEMLTGNWEVYGELKYTEYESKEIFNDNYKGTITFQANKKLGFVLTDGKKYTWEGKEYDYYIEESIIDYQYSILKKGGKNYISIGYHPFTFEIVSLKKNTFMLRMDEEFYDSENKSKAIGHIYMTIVSN